MKTIVKFLSSQRSVLAGGSLSVGASGYLVRPGYQDLKGKWEGYGMSRDGPNIFY